MTTEEQAEAILKAQEIVELDFQIFALDDLYADYHRQYENRETGRSFLASALLEKHKALEAAEKELATTIATARTSALKEAAGVAHAFAMRWADKPEPACESACSAGNEIAAAILAIAEVK